ncbi:MAG: DNA topoisomerase I [Desulfamplus sp.]|nr:DNA topoisomerase I [Desulfamplus sp.]
MVEKTMDPAFVRAQFDEILVREITSLIEIDSDIAMLTYNLSTISTIIIAVEREREIRNAKGLSIDRFAFNTLVDELVDLGLYQDDIMLKSVEAVITQGYLTQNSQGELKAEISAYTIVGFLDKIFPTIQGIQLIAFVMQMCDEVLSERKTLEYAKESFAQTLKKSGVSVTREKAEKQARELDLDNSKSRQMKEVALKLKEANIKRLAQQRFKKKLQMNKEAGKPSFHFDGGSKLDKVRITSVFDQGPSEETIEAEKKAKEETERKYQETLLKAAQLEEQQKKIKEAEMAAIEIERKAAEIAVKEQALREAEMAALKLEQQQAELRAKELEMAIREAELKLREEQLKAIAEKEVLEKNAQEMAEKIRLQKESEERAAQEQKEKEGREKEQKEQREKQNHAVGRQHIPDDIESRIAAFEAELMPSCPVCHNGKIRKEKTETDKEYYICSDRSCRFVSWSMPYLFSCPLCKHSFLVEFKTPSGEIGLKCPIASCRFSQNHLSDPALANPALAHSIASQTGNNPQHGFPHTPPTNYTTPPTNYAPSSGYAPQPEQTSGAEPPKKKRLVRRVKRK